VAGLLVSPPASYAGDPKLTVMTRNLYLGTAFDNVVAAEDFTEFVQAVTQDWANVEATDFKTRAKALAAEILRTKPDVVGLQEASLWRDSGDDGSDIVTGTAGPNATNDRYDFLARLQDELAAGGTAYTAVSTSTNADLEAPRFDSHSPNGFTDVRITDRDVILVRADLADKFSGAKNGHYPTQFSVPSFDGTPLTFTRGWASINYRHDANRTVRIVVTHLETEAGPAAQVAQGDELLGLVANDPNVVVLADVNSAADCTTTDTYGNLTEELDDAWWINRPNECEGDGPRKVSRPAGGNVLGLSCCMNELLDNSTSTATTRIDVVLSKGALTATSATVTGNAPFRRSPAPLWASDHFGVVAQLELAPCCPSGDASQA
jgi:endonuclease/exonuclease/phosphatase family metal-dependent hydrolase